MIPAPDRKLTGSRCQCGGCGEYFRSVRAFMRHRIEDAGRRRCRTVREMESAGMSVNPAGWWVGSAWKGVARVDGDAI